MIAPMVRTLIIGLFLTLGHSYIGYGQVLDLCPPVAGDDSKSTDEDAQVTINVIANDTDCPADVLTGGAVDPATVDLNTSTTGIQNSISTAQGSFSANGSGLVTFTPSLNYSGTASVDYTVNDNAGKTSNVATITITVMAVNNPPVANAGSDKTITLPTNSVVLNGLGSDSDGSIASYSWTEISGGAATLANANTATLTASGLVADTYVFRLTVTDNQGAQTSDDATVIVNPAANAPPVVNAGTDKSITLPTNSVVLTGSGTDSDGSIASYSWTKISGGAATLTNANTATLTASGLVSGTYAFRLTVTDNEGAQGSDDATITVNPADNVAPVANAGPDKTITLPTNSVVLTGSGTDSDGSISGYSWTKISGGAATLTNANTATLTASGLVAGTYVFRLTVTDNQGVQGSDDATVIVNPATNTAPVANAGTDKTITLPANSVVLTGSGTDSDGSITSYSWTKISGGVATLTNANTATLTASGLVAGTYVFKLTITDNQGAQGSDDATVTVNAAANVTPVANAGPDKTITLPANSVVLTGSGTDSDGSIASYSWTKVSGGAATLSNANTTSLTASGLVAGTYVFRLTVTDNQGALGSDEATITVNPAANVPPVANAGPDKTITLPTSSVVLNGSGTDSDGTITSYSWTKVSGGIAVLTNANTANLTASGLVAGAYVFRLTVTDNQGAQGSDDATVIVNLAGSNAAPVANAGPDKIITLPTNSATLDGSGTDSDGSVTAYSWTKVSGPSVTMTNTNKPTVSLSGLNAGVYTFRLTVTDNKGATGADDAAVTVNSPANNPPVANNDQIGTTKNTVVTINVVANDTDSDGTINAGTVDLNTATNGIQSTNNTSQGSFRVNTSGVVAFTPAANYVGAATLGYTVNDNSGATSNAATITVNVSDISNNGAPIAKNDSIRTSKDTPVTINVVENDTDSDGTINPATVDLNTSQSGIQDANNTSHGSFTASTSGVVTFAPAANYVGTVVISYTVNDIAGATSNVATIAVTVDETSVAFNGLDIPNAFTPNGDGANETWKILPRHGTELNQFQDAEVRVYNKHGVLLYETKGFESRWDGRQNGETLPADTYYYTIDLKIDNIKYKGIVTLLR